MLGRMLAALVLAGLVATGPLLPPPAPPAVRGVPDEAGSFVLPDAPTYQAVAADLDGDGARELVRLVAAGRGAIVAEGWAEDADGWEPIEGRVEVNPGRPTGRQGNAVYAGSPARLIVRQVEGRDRVTIVRQPSHEDPGTDDDCCLLLHDLVLAGDALRLAAVASPSDRVGAVLALDMDGDGTDELLATRSLSPQGTSFPTEARLYRWVGRSFGLPTVTELEVGSGDTPFILGDSDGLPGDEAAIISIAGGPGLFRIALGDGDALRLEPAALVAQGALAVPIRDGRGVAVIGPALGLEVRPWPSGGRAGDPVARAPLDVGALLGVVELREADRLVVRQTDPEAVHVLTLPTLAASGFTITRSPAAATFAASPLTPYIGPLPGGGADGEPAIIYAGRLLSAHDLPGAPLSSADAPITGVLAAAEPIGLLGRDRGWLAVLHSPLPLGRLDPSGGRLDAPVFQPGSGVSLAPIEVARAPETDDASLDPPLREATPLRGGEIAIGADGFFASVSAPPGSRVYVADADPSVVGAVHVVPATGKVRVPMVPPVLGEANHGYRTSLSVITPAGHGYVASWDVRVLSVPPTLEASVSTLFGSTRVEVSGRTAPYAKVTIEGTNVPVGTDGRFRASVTLPPWPTDVSVVATDPVGNATTTTLSGVGIFDYRNLPWVPIAVGLVALAAVALFLRVPGTRPTRRRGSDDAALEELEPD